MNILESTVRSEKRSETPMDVLVYQMGKVASSALVDALSRAGQNPYQCHFLTKESFYRTIDRFDNPYLTDGEKHHMSMQLQQNLILYSLIKQYESGAKKEKLCVISLTRDPLDWYFANLVQNFENYRLPIIKWAMINCGGNEGKLTAIELTHFFEHVFKEFPTHIDSLERNPAPMIRRLFLEAHNSKDPARNAEAAVYRHMMELIQPHFWFDINFEPLFNIDIFEVTEKIDLLGVFLEELYLKLVVVRYEDLSNSIHDIARFLQLPNLELATVNESSSKAMYEQVSSARTNMRVPAEFVEVYYTSRYCCRFDYSFEISHSKGKMDNRLSMMKETLKKWVKGIDS